MSHLDRPSRATGLGDEGSSVGLQTVGVLIVHRIRGYPPREETAMVDTRQHAVQTFRTCERGERIYGQKVIREYGNLVVLGHLGGYKYDRFMRSVRRTE